MRANEIIRGILDLIDNIDSNDNQPTVSISIGSTPIEYDQVSTDSNFEHDDIRRFKQIVDLANDNGELSPFSNSPNESYATVDAVTTNAGGGVNNPKHPNDQRVQHPSLYPGYQKIGE